MLEIVKTDSHYLAVDPQKNRIYCTMTGKSLPSKMLFLDDWQRALQCVKDGFTVLVDVTQFLFMSLSWIEMTIKLQQTLRQARIAGTAEIVSEPTFLEMHDFNVAEVDGRKIFTNSYEAEAWLDKLNHS